MKTRGKRRVSWLLGAAIFSLITAVFFWPSITTDAVPLPTDVLHDYLLDRYVTGENRLIRDTVVQMYPYSDFIFKSYKAGEIPNWNTSI